MKRIDEYGYLDKAIMFHDNLNPALWIDGDMKPEIRERLLAMAKEFQDFLNIDDLDIVDITVSGSNAAFTYTPHSDIDLHTVVRIPKGQTQLYTELFDAKKNLYNVMHHQTVKGYDVEFYVQNEDIPVESIGIYSLLRGEWDSIPKKVQTTVDDMSVQSKVAALSARIKTVLHDNNLQACKDAWDALKNMRKAGLERAGEFSPENLAFKIIRTDGLQTALFDKIIELKDGELSLESLGETQKLDELFDSKVDYKVLAKRRNFFRTEAEINGRIIEFEAAIQTDRSFPYWEVDFSEMSSGERKYGVTGSGGENAVFSMVLSSLNEFLNTYSPDTVMFSAMKTEGGDTRANIYTKMIKRYLPSNYEVEEYEAPVKRQFVIKKKE